MGKWTRNYTEGLSGGCVSGRGNRVSADIGRTLKSALGQVREDVRHQWQEAVFPLRWLHVVSTSPQFDELILVGKLCCWLRSSHQPTTFSSTIAPCALLHRHPHKHTVSGVWWQRDANKYIKKIVVIHLFSSLWASPVSPKTTAGETKVGLKHYRNTEAVMSHLWCSFASSAEQHLKKPWVLQKQKI